MARGEQNAVEKEKETAESLRKRSMERLDKTREKESQGYGKKRKKNDGIGKQLIISGGSIIENSN